MTWNYRLMQTVDDAEVWLVIHEVYYNDDGTLRAYTEKPAVVCGESIEELGRVLNRMKEALGKPILQESDFPEERE